MILMFSTSGKSFYRLSENMPNYLNKSLNGKIRSVYRLAKTFTGSCQSCSSPWLWVSRLIGVFFSSHHFVHVD